MDEGPATSFGKDPDTTVHGEEPLNLEPPLGPLAASFVTPRESFYVRNHGTIPGVDPAEYRLVVSGLVERPLELSLEDIKADFPKETLTAVLQCAGNRRDGLAEIAPIPGETPWGAGAIGNARWAGVPLREVLRAVGVRDGARHAAFEGFDEALEGDSPYFGGSVPIEKATGPEVLLAYEMNGGPLPPEHGFPLRVVVGGYAGARSVKWLKSVTLQREPSDNYAQARSYILYPPYVKDDEEAEGFEGLPIGEVSVNAAICEPADGASLPSGVVSFRGYAVAGSGRRVARVDLSADGGRTWVGADLSAEGEEEPWAWRLWEAGLELEPGRHRVVVRAVDSATDVQPERAAGIWNFKGYVNNAWHGIEVETL